jgi:transposase
MLADALGRPLRFILTPGQVNEITVAEELLQGVEGQAVLADKGYDSRALREHLRQRAMASIIPTIRTRHIQVAYDKEAYKLRNRIERCFGRLKTFRRIATRFDRRSCAFLASLYLAASVFWLN